MPCLTPDVDSASLLIGERSWKLLALQRVQDSEVFYIELISGICAELNEYMPGAVDISLWHGDPLEEVGIAVVVSADGTREGLVDIPLCGCGERMCGNVGVQFSHEVRCEQLPELLGYLEALPVLAAVPERGETWLHEFDEPIAQDGELPSLIELPFKD